MKANTAEVFWSRVDRNHPSGCWIWMGSRHKSGYGWIRIQGKIVPAHRLAYELTFGPIPEGKVLHHICENPLCVRPGEHVVPVTRRQNTVDFASRPVAAQHARLTHCKHGHPYDETNTRVETPRDRPQLRWRRCRECERLRSARRREAAHLAKASHGTIVTAARAQELAASVKGLLLNA